jgi:hypothetical protein
MLTEERITRPGYCAAQQRNGKGNEACCSEQNKHIWSTNTVIQIISKLEYCGATVNFRYGKKSYKDKDHTKNPRDKWVIFEGTHPEIVDRETWETAQRCRKTVRRSDQGPANPLTGKLFCADCGAKMYNHRKAGGKPASQNPNTGKVYLRSPADFYVCSSHTNAQQKFMKKCTQHHIGTKAVRAVILEAIKAASAYAKSNETDFIKQVREASAIQQDESAKSHKKRLAKEQKRVAELNALIRRIYEDNVNGKLSDKRFELLSDEYETEQAALEQSIARLQAELDSFNADSMRADKFIGLIQKYTDFTELTGAMINEFVDKVIVGEAEKLNGDRVQDVDVYLNFIGKFDAPPIELSPEEIAEDERKAKRREYERDYRERKRQKLTQQYA